MSEQYTGAASVKPDWPKRKLSSVENVRRLQARIVKARDQGHFNKMKVLQRMLTHSHSARVVAVERVTTNNGRNTPGVDGVIWKTPESKQQAVEMLKRRGYKPQPLRRIYIPKKNGKLRPLGIPTMLDRAKQAIWLMALDPVAEATADLNSYGFRKERSCADAIEQCRLDLMRWNSAVWVLEGDIKACFDRIDHEWILNNCPLPKEGRMLVSQWLKAGYIDKYVFYDTEEGTPQGGIISPVLANLALDGLEAALRNEFGSTKIKQSENKVHLVRYADDFIITGSSRELLEERVLPFVKAFMAERGLELSDEKTLITHIADGFDFLGQNIRKYSGKLITKPSKKNVKTCLDNLREIVRTNKALSAGLLIIMLNRRIRGWTNYHRHVCSSQTFKYVDKAIYEMLRRWTRRRHPNKNEHWIKQKYYTSVYGPNGGNNWKFYGWVETERGEMKQVFLRSAAKTKIRRHIKIRQDVNPYHPKWSTYLKKRHERRLRMTPKEDRVPPNLIPSV